MGEGEVDVSTHLSNLAFAILISIAYVAIPHIYADTPAGTTQSLVEILKAHLPEGWTITFNEKESAIDLHRVAPTLVMSIDGNPPPGEEPKMSSYGIALQVLPFVSIAEYNKLKSENEVTLKKLNALSLVLIRMPAVYQMGDEVFSQTKDPEIRAKIDAYYRVKATWHNLPDFSFRNISLSLISFNKEPVDEKVCTERNLINKNIFQVLTSYKQ